MNIVEQAARRLAQLQNAGIVVPDVGPKDVPSRPDAGVQATSSREPTPAAAMRKLAEQSMVVAPTAEPRIVERAMAELREASSGTGKGKDAQVAAPTPPHAEPQRRQPASAELDLARLQQAGYLVPTSTRTLLAEELRHIKRQLLKNARDAEPGAGRMAQIMVTSALPSEGKTFFSINLAISMAAEVNRSVLLIDADVIHPTLFQRVGLQPGKGLQDLLTDPEIDVSDVVMDTNIPKLSLLSAGTRNDRATELLASDAMEVILARLEKRYPRHIILFDAPPLLVTNEAKVLATRVGQVVMVVEAAKTAKSLVAQAFASVEHCPVVLSVLNKAPQTGAPLGYGYYYP